MLLKTKTEEEGEKGEEQGHMSYPKLKLIFIFYLLYSLDINC